MSFHQCTARVHRAKKRSKYKFYLNKETGIAVQYYHLRDVFQKFAFCCQGNVGATKLCQQLVMVVGFNDLVGLN